MWLLLCERASGSTLTPRLIVQNNYIWFEKDNQNKYTTKETIKKINNHTNTKDLRSSAFGLRPKETMENFTNKDEDYKYGVEALSHIPKPQYTQIALSHKEEIIYSLFKWMVLNKYQLNTQIRY
jgi:hypothetical protein